VLACDVSCGVVKNNGPAAVVYGAYIRSNETLRHNQLS